MFVSIPTICFTQEIRPVKVLGILCMIDEGEADWKVVTIDAEDKWAPFLNDIDDVEKLLPGTLSAIREWFRTYKIPDGKPPNVFGLDEKFMDKHYALEIIKECNHAWKDLITGEKERNMDNYDPEVKGLVRKLSKSNLVDLAVHDDDDEPPNFQLSSIIVASAQSKATMYLSSRENEQLIHSGEKEGDFRIS